MVPSRAQEALPMPGINSWISSVGGLGVKGREWCSVPAGMKLVGEL